MSFFTSFQELLDFDHSTNLNGFHFSNSLFGFDSNSLPTLENLPPPTPGPPSAALDHPAAAFITPPPAGGTTASPPSPFAPPRHPSPLLETPTKQQHQHHHLQQISPSYRHPLVSPEVLLQNHHNHHHNNHHVPQQQSPPVVSKFQLKVTPNNEIYISNESGTFCELAGSFVPSTSPSSSPLRASPELIAATAVPSSPLVLEEEEEPEPAPPTPTPPEPPKTLFCIERGVKRPLSPSDGRCYSGIFRTATAAGTTGSPHKKKSTSTSATASSADGLHGPEPEGAKLVVSNVINNGLIVNKKHLSTSEEPTTTTASAATVTPERRIMRPKKRKRKVPPKAAAAGVVTLEAKLEPVQNGGRIVTKIVPKKSAVVVAPAPAAPTITESALNFSGIKEKAAQEAIFSEKRVEKVVTAVAAVPLASVKRNGLNGLSSVPGGAVGKEEVPASVVGVGATAAVEDVTGGVSNGSNTAPVELKVVADIVMDKEVFGHISLLNNSPDRGKTVIYQNPVTSANVIYSILNPRSLNLALTGVDRTTTATLTLQPHRPGAGRKPKKRGRPPKSGTLVENGVASENGHIGATANDPPPPAAEPEPVMVTRSGRLSKPPRYANNYFQNLQQKQLQQQQQHVKQVDHSPPSPPPPLPPPDPETAEKLPNFSAALNSTTAAAGVAAEPAEQVGQKRKMTVPLQYRCATCNKIYLGKRMQRHLQKYPSHNSARDCAGTEREEVNGKGKDKDKEEKSTYLYKHLFDLLQRFTEKDKGRIMLKEISNFVDFVRALIPRLITNDEQNSTVEYIDHNVADVLRLNHGKYRLKLSSLAEEYEKLNLLNANEELPISTSLPITSTPNADRQSGFSFNADDLLNQSSSFPSLTTLMHEHNVLNTMLAPAPAPQPQQATTTTTNNNHLYLYNNNNNNHHHNHHHSHHHHLPLALVGAGSSCHDDAAAINSLLCKSPAGGQHHGNGMALNLY